MLTVTDVEVRAVLGVFRGDCGIAPRRPQPIGGDPYFDLGVVGGARTLMAQVPRMGSGGPGGSALTTEKAIRTLRPGAVVAVGIAFGVDHRKQKIGDILVSDRLANYDLQRVGTEKRGRKRIVGIVLRGSRPDASPRPLGWLKAAEPTWPRSKARVQFGLVLSGDKLVDNQDFRDQLRDLEVEAIGGEMEASGIYDAAYREKIDWIIVKAICDWADGEKHRNKEQRQAKAAANAARFLLHAVRQGGFAPPAARKRNAKRKVPTLVPERALRVRQLPPPPGDFVGREEEIKELVKAVGEGGAMISGLRGMGGVGKTALALVVADKLKKRFPDAQFFLDLQGISLKPLKPSDAMAHVVRGFRPEAKLPESEAELAGLYRSVLDGKRALLLMDNARDAAQVRPLIPPQGCVLLVTSRQHFALPGLYAKDLDRLPLSKARELLLKIERRIGDSADELARLCGCLPFALRAAASALKERPDLAPDRFAARLRDKRERLKLADAEKSVEATLALSYELLTPEQQRLWRALAVFPADLDAAGAAAVWGLASAAPLPRGEAARRGSSEGGRVRAPSEGVAEAQDLLGEVRRFSLIEWNEASRRWRLHDLARDFADAQLDDAERAEAQARLAAHYARVLGRADDLFLEGGDAILRGLALFDLERPNIEAGQAWAAERIGDDAEAARLVSDYPDAGAYVLDLRLHPRERIRWLESALAAARKLKLRSAEGCHLGNLGSAYADLGETRKAIECHKQNLTIAREIGDRRGEGNALGNLGLAYADLGETRRAVEHCEEALKIAKGVQDRRLEASLLSDLGRLCADMGELGEAIRWHRQALAVDREIGDREGEGHHLGRLGMAYASLGKAGQAIEFYERWLGIARELGDRRGEANAEGNLANAYREVGQIGEAIGRYERALRIHREIGDRRGEASDLGNLGLAHAALGETQRALMYCEQELDIYREIGGRRSEAKASWDLGLAYEKHGDLRRAVELMQVLVDYEREVRHADAEKDAAYVEGLRRKMMKKGVR